MVSNHADSYGFICGDFFEYPLQTFLLSQFNESEWILSNFNKHVSFQEECTHCGYTTGISSFHRDYFLS